LFQATLIAMGVATFSLVFATLHYYRCSLGGGMSDTERTLQARRADRFWLLGYTTMFLAPSLVLFLIRLRIVASVWLAFWLLYLFFVVRYFPRLQTPPSGRTASGARKKAALAVQRFVGWNVTASTTHVPSNLSSEGEVILKNYFCLLVDSPPC